VLRAAALLARGCYCAAGFAAVAADPHAAEEANVTGPALVHLNVCGHTHLVQLRGHRAGRQLVDYHASRRRHAPCCIHHGRYRLSLPCCCVRASFRWLLAARQENGQRYGESMQWRAGIAWLVGK